MIAHSPIEIHALFQNAFNSGDVQALTLLYEPGAILMVNGTPVTGRESIRATFESMVSVGTRINLVTRSIIESGDGVALLHGEWTVQRSATTAQPKTQGVSTEVVRKQPDGTWLFIIDNPYTPIHEQRRS
jgi:uncharacterized protein (TIGR02246 family)